MKTPAKNKKVNTLFRIDESVKRRAQKAAKKVDIPLSSIVNNYLYYFGTNIDIAFEYPSPRLARSIRQSQKEYERGESSPAFTNVTDMVRWLNRN